MSRMASRKNSSPSCRRVQLGSSSWLLLVLLMLSVYNSNGFLPIYRRTTTNLHQPCNFGVCLFARGRKLKKAQQKSGKQKVARGKRGKTASSVSTASSPATSANRVPRPTSTRRVVLTLDRPPPQITVEDNEPSPQAEQESSSYVRVCAIQVDDSSWWEHAQNTNPYGAKLWPSAMGVSQFLVGLGQFDASQSILELGCGCGLVSTVAAQNGATVIATDISNLVLSLTSEGWRETEKLPHSSNTCGSLTVQNFDLCSSQPLPLTLSPKKYNVTTTSKDDDATATTATSSMTDCAPRPIVIAAAMMYEADLAEALARRAAEAVNLGAWFIVGDDDTGQRENGRQKFEAELDRLLPQLSTNNDNSKTVSKAWTSTVVKHTALGWNEKRVKLLHLNAPPGILLEATAER